MSNFIEFLKIVVFGVVEGFTEWLDPLSDDLLKIFLDILSDNKYNLIASRFQRIMDRPRSGIHQSSEGNKVIETII